MKVKGTIPVGTDILKAPLSLKALKAQADYNGRVSVNVIFSLDDLIDNDFNSLNNLADERVLDDSIVGSLSDISYTVVGHLPAENEDGSTNYSYRYLRGAVIININADVSDIIFEEE